MALIMITISTTPRHRRLRDPIGHKLYDIGSLTELARVEWVGKGAPRDGVATLATHLAQAPSTGVDISQRANGWFTHDAEANSRLRCEIAMQKMSAGGFTPCSQFISDNEPPIFTSSILS